MTLNWPVVFSAVSAVAALVAAWIAYIAPRSAAQLAERLRVDAADRERKSECLRRVVAYRSMPPSQEWLAALNEVAVTFNDVTDVMQALSKFERHIRKSGGHDNADLLDLIKAMMKSLGLHREHIDDDFILRPFSHARVASGAVFPPPSPAP